MNGTQDHVQMIGPWGWLGWVAFAMTVLLYYRLWTSAEPSAVREMQEELEKARKTISDMRLLNKQLKEQNEDLRRKHDVLHGEYLALRQQLSKMETDMGRHEQLVDRIMRDLKSERDLRDKQYMELVRLKAQVGDL